MQPGVAVGRRLKAAGHEALLVSPARFADLARVHDLDFVPLAPDPQEIVQQQQDMIVRGGGKTTVRTLIDFLRLLMPYFDEAAREIGHACQRSDVLVHMLDGELMIYSVAEYLDIPTIAVSLQPSIPSCQLPLAGAPELPPRLAFAGSRYNALTYTVFQQLRWQMVRRTSNRWRAAHGLLPLGLRGPWGRLYSSDRPTLLAYSDTLVPRPPDYPAWAYSTGFWFLEHPEGWRPPGPLAEFLESGPAPVFVSLGSVTVPGTLPILEAAADALRRTKRRGIILDITADDPARLITDDILVARDVPYDWLLPRVSLAVHAAGAGTTAWVVRAGLRSVPVPVHTDQPFWAGQLRKLGVAAPPLHLKQLGVESLAAAIDRTLNDEAMGRRATELGARIRAEDGLGRAVAVLEQETARLQADKAG